MGAPRFALLLLCFTISGLAALVYQTAWSQELALAFGASQPAVAAVLAATMAGLAAGAALAGRFEKGIRRPLLTYALLELGIALTALAVPFAVGAAGAAQRALLAGRAEEGAAATSFALAAALLILFVPNALMGATLPLVARRVVRVSTELGPRLAALYTANTLGAAFGALLCAFVLIPRLGLAAATAVAVALNCAAAALAMLLDRGEAPGRSELPAPTDPGPPRGAFDGRWVLPAILVSGAISFTYEVIWTRLLSHLLGGSIYAFGTMLASFLVGLAIGSATAARWSGGPTEARRAFAVSQLATAGVSWVAFALLDRLPENIVSPGQAGAGLHSYGALAAAALMLPCAAAIGASLPLAIRVLARDTHEAASASSRVLVWNTFGSIAGALATGFLLLPALGFSGTLSVAIAVNLMLAALAAIAGRPRLRVGAALAAGLAVLLVVLPPEPPWRVLRSSPVSTVPATGDLAFFAVGRTATVLVLDTATEWRLSTDGMPEAAIQPPGARPGHQPVTGWLSLLPLAARPAAKSMLVIGLGGGSTLEEIPASVAAITVVEIEPEVVRANRELSTRRRRDPLTDPRLRVVVNDARSFLRLADRPFDVIVSQPSHPWTAGASHLFTREAFELARERLAPDGVLVQWIGLSLVDAETLRSLVATLGSVFPHVEAFCPPPGTAVLFLASRAPLGLDAGAAATAVATTPAWRTLGALSGDDLLVARVLDDESSVAFAADAPWIRDHRNFLAIRSPRLVRRPLAPSLSEIQEAWGPFDPLPRTPGVDRLYVTSRLLDEGVSGRALRIASAITDPVARETAFALAALARGDAQRGQAELWRLVNAHPEAVAPRRALVRWWQQELGDAERRARLAPLVASDPVSTAVVEGWRLLAAEEGANITRWEPQLAEVDPRDLLYAAATRLRIAWRLASGKPEAAREAINLLDPLLAARAPVRDLLVRARLGRAAGDPEIVLASLAEVAVAARERAQLAPAARTALALLDQPGAVLESAAVSRLRTLLEQAATAGSTSSAETPDQP